MADIEQIINEPDTLVSMCISYCINYPEIFTEKDPSYNLEDIHIREDCNPPPSLKSGLILPMNLCDRLLTYYTQNATTAWNPNALYDDILNIFKDVERAQLSQAIVRADFGLFHKGIETLSDHPLRHLEFSCCNYCNHTPKSVFLPLRKLSSTLRVLKLWQKVGCDHCAAFFSEMLTLSQDSDIIHCPNIQVLSLQNLQISVQPDVSRFFSRLVEPLVRLTHLDISGCRINENHLDFLSEVPLLCYLNLSCTDISPSNLKKAFECIVKVKNLRHLDLSQAGDHRKIYKNAEENMTYLIQALPGLVSLDISSTNLAENKSMLTVKTVHKQEVSAAGDSSEPVIKAFKGKLFEFLGLFGCEELPCSWNDIPAKKFTADHSDEHLVFSLHVYKENGHLLKKVLEAMFTKLQADGHSGKKFQKKYEAVQGILNGLQWHPDSRDIQRGGCACLFFLMRSRKFFIPQTLQQRVTRTLIFSLNQFQDDGYVVKCCLMCFLCLNLPDIAITCHVFKWYVACLIEALWNFEGDIYEKIGLRLLHEACRADYKEKDIVAEQRAISLILQIVERKLEASLCDENLERAWSCLWSLTDEMPLNCRRFLDENGMTHYMKCINTFSEEAGLLRKLTGLMANMSEVKYLRPELMTEQLISIFSEFLDSQLDDKSVSYHAASIMSEFAADGDEAWTVESPTREEIQEQIIQTVKSWDIDEAKKIKYRSLSPMLRLIQEYDTVAAQYWAIWALCNLTKVKEESYCPMLEMEGGVEILESVLNDPRPSSDVHQLIEMTLQQYRQYKVKRNSAPDVS